MPTALKLEFWFEMKRTCLRSMNMPTEAWGYSGVENSGDRAEPAPRAMVLMTYDRKLKFDAKAVQEINDVLH